MSVHVEAACDTRQKSFLPFFFCCTHPLTPRAAVHRVDRTECDNSCTLIPSRSSSSCRSSHPSAVLAAVAMSAQFGESMKDQQTTNNNSTTVLQPNGTAKIYGPSMSRSYGMDDSHIPYAAQQYEVRRNSTGTTVSPRLSDCG
jgi:hypothetical protein